MITREQADELRTCRAELGVIASAFLADNDEANRKILELDRLILMTESNIADLRAERIRQVAIADYSIEKAIDFHAKSTQQKGTE